HPRRAAAGAPPVGKTAESMSRSKDEPLVASETLSTDQTPATESLTAKRRRGAPINLTLRRSPIRLVAELGPTFARFVRSGTFGSIWLILATVAALLWANVVGEHYYLEFWHHRELTVGVEGYKLSMGFVHWINDGLMTIFFLFVGLEIKREILTGELSSARQAALPVLAAAGGMIAPALIYLWINSGLETTRGWGIPTATDIAFSLGILSLLGKRVPLGLKIFLSALAIADDLGAVVVIALFYTAELNFTALGAALAIFGLLLILNRAGVKSMFYYAVLGGLMWLAMFKSGVHATIAGVLLAFALPSAPKLSPDYLLHQIRSLADDLHRAHVVERDRQKTLFIVDKIEDVARESEAPLNRVEHGLHPWITYLIMPLFAISNAGVTLEGGIADVARHPVALGVFLGLVLGKQLGVTIFTWLAVKTRIAALPQGVDMKQIYGVSWLCGIGFTMSLFVSELAFETLSEEVLVISKFAVFGASVVSAVVGLTVLSLIYRSRPRTQS
ncbi:MAG: Na+/H+ antiporter NhaA, partial [Bacteroidia bacterium]|nr:Na+/H+ antiporter NhaA [Bacteroidia bacterium]